MKALPVLRAISQHSPAGSTGLEGLRGFVDPGTPSWRCRRSPAGRTSHGTLEGRCIQWWVKPHQISRANFKATAGLGRKPRNAKGGAEAWREDPLLPGEPAVTSGCEVGGTKGKFPHLCGGGGVQASEVWGLPAHLSPAAVGRQERDLPSLSPGCVLHRSAEGETSTQPARGEGGRRLREMPMLRAVGTRERHCVRTSPEEIKDRVPGGGEGRSPPVQGLSIAHTCTQANTHPYAHAQHVHTRVLTIVYAHRDGRM